jgi:hypothetical protein
MTDVIGGKTDPMPASRRPVVVLAAVGLAVVLIVGGIVAAVLVSSYVERSRFTDELEATGLVPYLPQVPGYELDFVADPDPDPLTDEPQLSLWYVDADGDQIVVHVQDPDADPCGRVTDCRTVDGVTTGFQGDGEYAVVAVVRDDALLTVTEQQPGAIDDPDALVTALADAPHASYADLGRNGL